MSRFCVCGFAGDCFRGIFGSLPGRNPQIQERTIRLDAHLGPNTQIQVHVIPAAPVPTIHPAQRAQQESIVFPRPSVDMSSRDGSASSESCPMPPSSTHTLSSSPASVEQVRMSSQDAGVAADPSGAARSGKVPRIHPAQHAQQESIVFPRPSVDMSSRDGSASSESCPMPPSSTHTLSSSPASVEQVRMSSQDAGVAADPSGAANSGKDPPGAVGSSGSTSSGKGSLERPVSVSSSPRKVDLSGKSSFNFLGGARRTDEHMQRLWDSTEFPQERKPSDENVEQRLQADLMESIEKGTAVAVEFCKQTFENNSMSSKLPAFLEGTKSGLDESVKTIKESEHGAASSLFASGSFPAGSPLCSFGPGVSSKVGEQIAQAFERATRGDNHDRTGHTGLPSEANPGTPIDENALPDEGQVAATHGPVVDFSRNAPGLQSFASWPTSTARSFDGRWPQHSFASFNSDANGSAASGAPAAPVGPLAPFLRNLHNRDLRDPEQRYVAELEAKVLKLEAEHAVLRSAFVQAVQCPATSGDAQPVVTPAAGVVAQNAMSGMPSMSAGAQSSHEIPRSESQDMAYQYGGGLMGVVGYRADPDFAQYAAAQSATPEWQGWAAAPCYIDYSRWPAATVGTPEKIVEKGTLESLANELWKVAFQSHDARVSKEDVPAKAAAVEKLVDLAESCTTIVMRNVPHSYSSKELMNKLDNLGFIGKYDFVYIPLDFKRLQKNRVSSLGYAYVNFSAHAYAKMCIEKSKGLEWRQGSQGNSNAQWGTFEEQGLDKQIEKWRNSTVMSSLVPDIAKPVLLKDGHVISFPPPDAEPKPPPTFRRARSRSIGARAS